MFDCTVTDDLGVKWLTLSGRIDSLTSPDVRRQMSDLVLMGQRVLVVDLGGINYMSSAGLRVFMESQKQIKTAGGEIVLFRPSDSILELLHLSSFDQIFRIVSDRAELQALLNNASASPSEESVDVRNITFRCRHQDVERGTLKVIGSQAKLASSGYAEGDVVPVKACDLTFGTGLATMGDKYEDYKNFFGETLVLNRHLFFYPAVKRPAVDIQFCLNEASPPEYKFLHGFGFRGDFSHVLSFEGKDGFVTLNALIDALQEFIPSNLFGLVILAESKGFWGMNLRRVPLAENKPENGSPIFSSENFSEWVYFPVESAEVNHIIAAAGLAVREKSRLSPEARELFSEGSACHVHGGVFAKEPLTKKIESFEDELRRVVMDLEITKVQHVLGQTQFNHGLVGIVELEG